MRCKLIFQKSKTNKTWKKGWYNPIGKQTACKNTECTSIRNPRILRSCCLDIRICRNGWITCMTASTSIWDWRGRRLSNSKAFAINAKTITSPAGFNESRSPTSQTFPARKARLWSSRSWFSLNTRQSLNCTERRTAVTRPCPRRQGC